MLGVGKAFFCFLFRIALGAFFGSSFGHDNLA